jgi:hypothetical protein
MMRLDFLSIVLATIGINFYIFDPLFIPREDAKIKLEIFYFFYNNVIQNGAWPLWMPLHTFGLPTTIWQWIGLTPMHYAGIFIGKILHLTDVAGLFKICHLCNELIFVTGLYLLSRLLWGGRYIPWLLCLGCGLFHWWYIDLDMKFHVFYFLPWLLWFLVRFFQTGKAWNLWVVPIGLIVWVMGNCLYYLVLWGWLLAIFTAVMWWTHRQTFRPEFTSPSSRIALAAMLLVLAAFGWQFHDFYSHTTFMQRLAGGGKNSLADFISYGPVPIYQGSWENLIHYFVLGDIKDYYLPSAFFVFAVWALCFVRQPVALALLFMTGALISFSFQGWVTYLSYFLPGMSFFHAAGNTFGLVKALITLLAGYGISDFLNSDGRRRWVRLGWIVLGIILSIDGLQLTLHYAENTFAQNRDPLAELFNHAWGGRLIALVLIGLMAMLLAHVKRFRNVPAKGIRVGLALWLFLDLAANYPGFAPDMEKFHWQPAQQRLWNITSQTYQPIRSPEPLHERDKQLWSLFKQDTMYACLFSVMNFDPCWPQARVDFITKRLSSLINVNVPPQVTGCLQPKLRFMTDATTVATMQEALSQVQTRGLDVQKPVIETTDQFPSAQPLDHTDNQLRVMAYDPDRLKIDFNSPSSGWLIYADTWYPGWKAWINGQPASIYPADIAFKAVHLPRAGKTVIEWKFMPFPNGLVTIGWVILGIAVAFLLLWALLFTLITSLL